MRIAIVGAGLTGLSAAHSLSEDPRHEATVFETRARLGGPVDECLLADSLDRLSRLGVPLRRGAQVERLAVDATGADLWIHGCAEYFDVALVATSAAERRALLVRSGLGRHADSTPLRRRVYFTEDGIADATEAARAALVRMAADHASVRPRTTPPRSPGVAHALRSLVRRAGAITAGRVAYLDLSGETWPLHAPAVYIANQRWVLEATVPQRLAVTPARHATVDALEAGASLAVVIEDAGEDPSVRAAALAALEVNAPIVPIAARELPARASLGRTQSRTRVVIGEPFYPETSSTDELMRDMRAVMRHLERVPIEDGTLMAPGP